MQISFPCLLPMSWISLHDMNCLYTDEKVFIKYQTDTRVSTQTVRHISAYIITFVIRHNEFINEDVSNNLHTSTRVSLVHFICSPGDVTIWWRHKCTMGCNNCEALTRKARYNSLDIDFIHGHIHDRSCKKHPYSMGLLPNTQNCGCACTGNAGNVFPVTADKRSRHASRHVRHARAVMHAGIAN